MSGGGGGGGGGGSPAAPEVGTTPYARAPSAITSQPTLPGFQDMLINQLMAGFGSGGRGTDLAALLSSMYRPMTTYAFQEPIAATKAAYDKTKNAPISTGNPTLDKLLMGA